MYIANAAIFNHFTHMLEVAVKAAVKTNLVLDTRFFNLVKHFSDFIQIMVDGLFTENMFPGFCRFNGNRGMHIG